MNTVRAVWNFWKRIGQALGDLIARVFLMVFYFTIFMPFGIFVRLFRDMLSIQGDGPVTWVNRPAEDPSLEGARRLY